MPRTLLLTLLLLGAAAHAEQPPVTLDTEVPDELLKTAPVTTVVDQQTLKVDPIEPRLTFDYWVDDWDRDTKLPDEVGVKMRLIF